jgi:putative transposase
MENWFNALCSFIYSIFIWLCKWHTRKTRRFHPSLRAVHSKASPAHYKRKPDWVREALLSLAVTFPHAGYRTLANCFNLQQAQRTAGNAPPITVSKSFVADLLRAQRYAVIQARHKTSTYTVRRETIQTTWGMDITGLPLVNGSSVPVFGIIDHGSRAILTLTPVATYNSLILLGHLLLAMGSYGKPRAVRSDNDAVFKTALFRCMLKLLGVRQQFTSLGSPWQNGRIERFWRSLKEALQTSPIKLRRRGIEIQTRMKFTSLQAMQAVLVVFKFSYNAYRPHQSLKGLTPIMAWNAQVQAALNKPPTKVHGAPSSPRKRTASKQKHGLPGAPAPPH